ncbi:HNH endonuclease [Zunongwangia profunda]|uniref:HNH endonuclease n=1 Tax=Zunongwangia profunda TaxID=398743 RepID=UPI00248DBB83|nr:HNH endonuclease [Zunongwangia profunda]|tara:strand:- start:19944 stop:20285 length:342 start_codon:yes stop_codon:yes gene_type:complete
MPYSRKPKKKPWVQERKPFYRAHNNSWFYNDYRWRKFTKRYKQRHPLCKDCKENNRVTETKVVDHKVQYKKGAPGWDLDNLKDEDFNPMCASCHNSKSSYEGKGMIKLNKNRK